jgi:hypothetical protein
MIAGPFFMFHRFQTSDMTPGIAASVCVLVTEVLLRMAIGFSMRAPGFACLVAKQQNLGLVAEQVDKEARTSQG